jgi:hypothetical protein
MISRLCALREAAALLPLATSKAGKHYQMLLRAASVAKSVRLAAAQVVYDFNNRLVTPSQRPI